MKAHRKLYKSIFHIVTCALPFGLFAQTLETSPYDVPTDKEWVIRPKVGIGVGMLTFYGDLKPLKRSRNPLANRGCFHLNAAQPVNDFLELNFSMMFGTLESFERTDNRNLNFRSNITSGGLNLSYNFSHLLPAEHVLEPFISIGVEAFEFVSKTDLYDRFGNEYHYWSDGSIRNIPESAGNSSQSVVLTRDYVFETDIRSMNADGFGDYSEHSLAIPIGAGANFLVNRKVEFKMGTEFHWTFTDYIDGITAESRGVRSGKKGPDKFLHAFVRLSYNLTELPRQEAPDFSFDLQGDADLDSISDLMDDCPNTPIGVAVDNKGCPTDSDKDGVADYLDQEPASPEGAIVDSVGIALDDAAIEKLYQEYLDGSGLSQYENTTYAMETAERRITRRPKPTYSVKIAEFDEAISDSMAAQLLSMPDVSTRQSEDGKTIVEAANISSLSEAVERKVELESAGIETGDVTETGALGKTERVTTVELDAVSKSSSGLTVDQAIAKNKALPPPAKLIVDKGHYTLNRPIDERSVAKADDQEFHGQTVYRVQIGAFANKLSNDVFDDMDDLLVVTTSDGLTRYYSGSHTTYEAAASKKLDMIGRGFRDAYVVPFKNGKQLTLEQAGATEQETSSAPNPLNTAGEPAYRVKFKVQIGAFKSQIPADVLDKMMDLGDIDQRKGEDGATHYYSGDFETYEEAKAYADELTSKGFSGAFVAGEVNGKIVPATEAQELSE